YRGDQRLPFRRPGVEVLLDLVAVAPSRPEQVPGELTRATEPELHGETSIRAAAGRTSPRAGSSRLPIPVGLDGGDLDGERASGRLVRDPITDFGAQQGASQRAIGRRPCHAGHLV